MTESGGTSREASPCPAWHPPKDRMKDEVKPPSGWAQPSSRAKEKELSLHGSLQNRVGAYLHREASGEQAVMRMGHQSSQW